MNSNEVGISMEVLTRVDLGLAYSSKKLVNLDTLLMLILAVENNFEAMAAENEIISLEAIENALTNDLLSAYLVSEVGELENFMSCLQVQVADARLRLSPCMHLRESFPVLDSKLHDSEELLKRSQEHVLELKMQLAKLQIASTALNHNDWKRRRDIGLPENFEVANIDVKVQVQTIERKRILRMLEKSLSRELELEKKIKHLKQSEEDLILKLKLTEQVSLHMEEAAEVVWGRFLEAENAAEVLMGISKELAGRFQIVQFYLNSSLKREEEMKCKLQHCLEQLKSKETAVEKLNSCISKLAVENSEVVSLREKVEFLEKRLKESDFQLEKAKASNEANEEQIKEMDCMIESLKENIYLSENRTENAEAKIVQLSDTNLELTEEMGFLKASNERNSEKLSISEKQLRGLEVQLQNAKASSEASQEQQNMLYSAIWDMETLIDELKQKVSIAETRAENAEEQHVLLSEAKMELEKEVDFLRSRMEYSEMSLSQAKDEKMASAKNINIKSNLIMDMVVELAVERERIRKRLYALTEENKKLMEKLYKTKKDALAEIRENGDGDEDDKSFASSSPDSIDAACKETSDEAVTALSSERLQVDELPKNGPSCETELGPSVPVNTAAHLAPEYKAESRQSNRMCAVMVVLVLFTSVLAAYFFKDNYSFSNAFDS